MIHDFEKYHGVALRQLLVEAGNKGLFVRVEDSRGRLNSFVINNQIGLHIKHSSKRMPPWQFTFLDENCEELASLGEHANQIWIALVCGPDGVVCLTYDEFLTVNPDDCQATAFVRVDRDKRAMYRVRGSEGTLAGAKPRGFARVMNRLQDQS
jgi:hypothetical protein